MLIDSRKWQIDARHKGLEAEPLVIIDNFLVDAQRLIDEAARMSFTPMAAYYPGVRAPTSSGVRHEVIRALLPVFTTHFDIRENIDVQSLVYSLATTPAEALAPIQRLPHYDGVEPGRLAFVLYLCDERHGGTGFYRHRSTGFETVSSERYATFSTALQRDVATHGLPPAQYIVGDTPIYARIDGSAAVFNRALVYRGRNLHSADIGPEAHLSADPRRGRLTLNGFLTGR